MIYQYWCPLKNANTISKVSVISYTGKGADGEKKIGNWGSGSTLKDKVEQPRVKLEE